MPRPDRLTESFLSPAANSAFAVSPCSQLQERFYLPSVIFQGCSNTCHEIQVPKSGVKHTIAGSSDELVRTVPAIPELIQKAILTNSEGEKGGDPNILAVETYEATLEIDGKRHRAIMTVKLYRDGRRYYDHGLVK